MRYFYKNEWIEVPKDEQKDIHLKSYNGEFFILDNKKISEFTKKTIYNRLDELKNLRVKNNYRYGHYIEESLNMDNIYLDEIKKLECQLKDLNK